MFSSISPSNRKEALILFLVLCSCVIIARFVRMPIDDENLSKYKNTKVRLVGTINTEPDETPSGKKFNLLVTEIITIKNGDVSGQKSITKLTSPSLVLVKSNSFDTQVQYGSKVEIFGKLESPEVIIGDDGRVFDYPKYLAKNEIFYLISRAQIQIVGERMGNKILEHLYLFKHAFISNIESALPAPESFLANGLVISGKGSMSKELQLEFQKVGLIHIVVLSGSNISIIGETIVRTLSFLPTLWSSVFGGIGIVLFSSMTGGGATVIRSAIMSIIALAARVTNRQNDALVSLMIAGSVMLTVNPYLLFYDPSFQLSFAASLGLILYSPRAVSAINFLSDITKKKIHGMQKLSNILPAKIKEFLIEIVSSSLATQLATLPLILHMSGMVSVVSLPVNILLLPLIPYTMLSVFVLGVTSFMSISFSKLFAFVSWILLTFLLRIVHIVSELQFSIIQFPPISNTILSVMYILMSLEFVYFYKRKNRILFAKPVLTLRNQS